MLPLLVCILFCLVLVECGSAPTAGAPGPSCIGYEPCHLPGAQSAWLLPRSLYPKACAVSELT